MQQQKTNQEATLSHKQFEEFLSNLIVGPECYINKLLICDKIGLLDSTYKICNTHKCHDIFDAIPREYLLQKLKTIIQSKSPSTVVLFPSFESFEVPVNTFLNINHVYEHPNLHSDHVLFNPMIVTTENIYQQNDLLQKKFFKINPTNAELNEQFAVIAQKDIPANVVIGFYIGIELTQQQFNFAYQSTRKQIRSDSFCLTNQFGDEYCLKDQLGDMKSELDDEQSELDDEQSELGDIKSEDSFSYETKLKELVDIETGQIKINSIVVDGGGLKTIKSNNLENLMIYINDGRPDLKKEIPDNSNAMFVTALYGNWPITMVVTIDNIESGSEILVNYGKHYHKVITETKRWMQSVEEMFDNVVEAMKSSCEMDVSLNMFLNKMS